LLNLFLGGQLDLPIHVYGPETHMTAIVAMALGQEPIEDPQPTDVTTGNFLLPSMVILILLNYFYYF
jgi:ATP citrate (pro-S)-lyase